MLFEPTPDYSSATLIEAILNNDGYHLSMVIANSSDVPAIFKLLDDRKYDADIVSRGKEVLNYMLSKGKLTMSQLKEYDRRFINP